MYVCMMDGWMDVCIYVCMYDGWMDGCIYIYIYILYTQYLYVFAFLPCWNITARVRRSTDPSTQMSPKQQ